MISSSRYLKTADGYSLLEVLVSLVVATLVGATVMAAYVLADRWVVHKREAIVLENNLEVIVYRVALDVSYAESMWMEADSSWTLGFSTRPPVTLTCRDGVLTRNGVAMHDTVLTVTAFRIVPSEDATRHASLPTPHTSHEPTLQASLTVGLRGRRQSLSGSTSVMLRQRRPWPSAFVPAGP